MKAFILAACAALLACASPTAAQQQPAHSMPDWWLQHVDFMTRDGGVWYAPNPSAETNPDLPQGYGMHWRAENQGHVLVGRLYGVDDGEETREFWSFREFWHPGERRALLQQWGGPGVYGVGEVTMEGNRASLEQTFWLPDGRSWRDGHRTVEDGDTYVTEQYEIDESDAWSPNGTFVWRRVRADPEE